MASGYGVFRHSQSECRTIAVCLRDQSTRGEDFLARSLGSGSHSREGIVTLRVFYFSARPTRGVYPSPSRFLFLALSQLNRIRSRGEVWSSHFPVTERIARSNRVGSALGGCGAIGRRGWLKPSYRASDSIGSNPITRTAALAQLGERSLRKRKVPSSTLGGGSDVGIAQLAVYQSSKLARRVQISLPTHAEAAKMASRACL